MTRPRVERCPGERTMRPIPHMDNKSVYPDHTSRHSTHICLLDPHKQQGIPATTSDAHCPLRLHIEPPPDFLNENDSLQNKVLEPVMTGSGR